MEEFERIESLMKTKAYSALTKAERNLIDQELGEETYEQLRSNIIRLQDEKLAVNSDIKRSLMTEFRGVEGFGWKSFLNKKLPAYTHLIGLPLLIVIYFFLPAKEKVVLQDRLVEVPVRDTVMVTQVDTLWMDRIVEIPTTVYVLQKVEQPENEIVQQTSNLSLSDQKEVLELVVRGLDE